MNKRLIITITIVGLVLIAAALYFVFSNRGLSASTAVGGTQIVGVCYGEDNLPLALTDQDTCLIVLGGSAWDPSRETTSTQSDPVYSCERNGRRSIITSQQEVLDCAGYDFLACEYVDRGAYERNESAYCSDRVRQWRIKFGLE